MEDRHLNLYYTYNTRHLEDNVTRAFVLTLKRLAPVHLRLLLRDCLLEGLPIRNQIELSAKDDFEFDLQRTHVGQLGTVAEVHDDEEIGELLTDSRGFLVGITRSGEVSPTFEMGAGISEPPLEERGRPDAWIADVANGIAGVLEIKLGDDLYESQLRRHFKSFFDSESTSIQDVFAEVSWDDIAGYLEKLEALTRDQTEREFIREFVDYVDMQGLVEFRSFRESDFMERSRRTRMIRRFLTHIKKQFEGVLEAEIDPRRQEIYFNDNPYENLWLNLSEEGLCSHIVVGAGKGAKWRSRAYRDVLRDDPDSIRSVLDRTKDMLTELSREYSVEVTIELAIHSRFFYTRFQTDYLWNIADSPKPYTAKTFDHWFVPTFTSENKNAYKRITKQAIQQRFSEELAQRTVERDSDGLFPKWDDAQVVLQNCRFSIGVCAARNAVASMDPETVSSFARELLTAEKDAIEGLASLVA